MEVLVNVKKQTTEAIKQFVYIDVWDTLEEIKKQSWSENNSYGVKSRADFEDNQKQAMFCLRVVFKSCMLELLERASFDEKRELENYLKKGIKELAWK